MVAVYDYTDEDGELLYQVVRFSPKEFRPRRPDGFGGWKWGLNGVRRVPYGLRDLSAAVDSGRRVFVVEGEKDADALSSLGFTTTTVAGGANAPLPNDLAAALAGADVAILPDNDAPGRSFANRVARAVASAVASIRIVDLPGLGPKGDVSDWIAAGGTPAALADLVEAATQLDLRAPDFSAEEQAGTDRSGPQLLADLARRTDLLEEPTSLIPSLAWPGRVTLMSSREKTGKSTLTAQAIAALSNGESFLGQEALGAETVLLYSIDEHLRDAVQRLLAFRANPQRVYVCAEPPSAASLKRDLESTGARLVVIDTLTELWSGRIESDRDANEVGVALRPYVVAIREHDAALLLLHHTLKYRGEYRGSVQLGALVDVVLTLSQAQQTASTDADSDGPSDDGRRRLVGKGRAGIRVDERLTFDGTRYSRGDQPLPLRQRILRALLDDDASSTELATLLTKRKADVLAELRSLKRGGLAEQSGKKPWRLTDAGRLEASGLTPARRSVSGTGTASEPVSQSSSAQWEPLRTELGTAVGHGGTAASSVGLGAVPHPILARPEPLDEILPDDPPF